MQSLKALVLVGGQPGRRRTPTSRSSNRHAKAAGSPQARTPSVAGRAAARDRDDRSETEGVPGLFADFDPETLAFHRKTPKRF
jgi:hypothetical protein